MLILLFIVIMIISIFVGISTGKLLFNMYKLSTIEYHGPNSSKIKNKIYKNKKNNKCYIFEPHLYICPVFL